MSQPPEPGRGLSRAELLRMGGAAAALGAVSGLARPPAVGAGSPPSVPASPTFANVKDFGATGDGVTDDTAAIQAAIDASLGVLIPEGVYRCTSTISLRNASHLVGEARGSSPGVAAAQLDFSGFNHSRALQGPPGGAGEGHAVAVSNLWVKGQAWLAPDIEGFPSVGYYAHSQNSSLSLVNCSFTGFTVNCLLEDVATALLLNVSLGNAVRTNLLLWGGCYNVRVLAGTFTVANEAGRAAPSAILSNIWLLDKPTGHPRSVTIQGCVIDEVARFGQGEPPATVRISKAEDTVIAESVVWVPVNDGSGYGVTVGAGSRRVRIRDVRVEPYQRDSNHVPVATVRIDPGAQGVALTNLSTDPNGGGDIDDRASDTVWLNVNGSTRLPGGVAPGEVAVLPDPGGANRGQLLRLAGAEGAADTLWASLRGAGGVDAWAQLGPAPGEGGPDALDLVVRERRLPGLLHGLQNWYDLSAAPDYGAVPDLSGRGRVTSARYGSRDPVPATDPFLFGGQRFARFDGGLNRALVAPTAVSGSVLTVMVVGRVAPGAGALGRLFCLTAGSGPDFAGSGSCLVYHSAAGLLTSYRAASLTTSEVTGGRPFALVVTYDGSVNRHQVTEGDPSPGVPSLGGMEATELVMGAGKQLADVIGIYALACDLVEVAVWDRLLPPVDLAALGTYARRRWAL